MTKSDVKLRECREAFEAEFVKLHSNNRLAVWNDESQTYETLYARQLWKMWQAAWSHTDHLLEMAVGALRFYADEIRYMRVHRCADSSGSYAGNDLDFDKGKRATEALLTLQQHLGKECIWI